MIPRDTIDRIFSSARIEEVVSDYVSLKKRGANLIGLCPFHDEKTGSFTVSPSKGIYKCFGCGKAGNAVGFIMEIEQCGYIEALRMLAKRYHIEIEERELTQEEQQRQDDRESMFVVNEWANEWFQKQLWDTREGQAVGLTYLRERGLQDETIHKFKIGYSPDKSLLSKEAVQHGFTEKYLLNDSQNAPFVGTGVCLKSEDGRLYDRFHSRVIFPFFSQSGKVVGFAGRLLKKSDKAGKYVNSPTSPLFEKHNELYGLYQAKQTIARLNHAYLVEGQMDVISMHQAGITNVVASGGTSLTVPQIKLLHRFTDSITVLYDGDAAGIHAAVRGIDMILEEGINVKVLLLPEGEDPDSYARSHNASDFIAYIDSHQTDFIRFKAQLLSQEAGSDPVKRSALIRSVVDSIAVIPDAITRQVYIKDCADLLHIDERLLLREVSKTRKQKYIDATQPNAPKEPQPAETTAVIEQPTPAPEPVAQKTAAAKRKSPFEMNFLNILRLIVRYGERQVFEGSDGAVIRVGEYVISEMQGDDIHPQNPLHQQILDEYMAHYQDPGFVAEQFFVRHDNPEISRLAVDLVADKYQLSRIFSRQAISENVVQNIEQQTDADRLPELANRLLLELKYTVVTERIAQLDQLLKQAQEAGDWASIRELLRQQPLLLKLRKDICKSLGNRVIVG